MTLNGSKYHCRVSTLIVFGTVYLRSFTKKRGGLTRTKSHRLVSRSKSLTLQLAQALGGVDDGTAHGIGSASGIDTGRANGCAGLTDGEGRGAESLAGGIGVLSGGEDIGSGGSDGGEAAERGKHRDAADATVKTAA